MKKIILASRSPRRADLLSGIGIKFDIFPTDIPEETVFVSGKEIVCDLSYKKALKTAEVFPDAIVIGADTVVVHNDDIFGKPQNESDAARMLSRLSGRWHDVFTGISVICEEKHRTEAVLTRVKFRNLEETTINAYISTGEPMDKAGAYGIQGLGSLLVEEISGDFYNVMGMPLGKLAEIFMDLFKISFIVV